MCTVAKQTDWTELIHGCDSFFFNKFMYNDVLYVLVDSLKIDMHRKITFSTYSVTYLDGYVVLTILLLQ